MIVTYFRGRWLKTPVKFSLNLLSFLAGIHPMKHYDYIICGGGMAGLSLAYYLKNSKLADKSVLIIEPQEKNTNDRTWAFWEREVNTFESFLIKKWDNVQLIDANGNKQMLDMGGYQYKLLRGKDFYDFVNADLQRHQPIEWLKDTVTSIKDNANSVVVETTDGQAYEATLVFDSTYQLNLTQPLNHNLLQHFKGYVVRTAQAAFNPDVPVLMNFNIDQKQDCRFMYLLPLDAHTALVEYTIFSETLLPSDDYDAALRDYLNNDLQLPEYQVLEEEFGVIPMSDVPTTERPSPRVVRIGTAGGYTNPATGYTFANTQRKLKKLVENLEQTGSPKIEASIFDNRFRFYASVLLNVLEQKRHSAADIFAMLYRKNPPARVFSFLDGHTSLAEELKIMNSVPRGKFLAAVGAVMIRKTKAWLNGQLHP